MNYDEMGLTPSEEAVLNDLKSAWNIFSKLSIQHSDHQNEFRFHIHSLQRLIAVRVARRVDPHLWSD